MSTEDRTESFDKIPQSFGEYDRLDEGREGGMGVVYKVLNRRLHAVRALKILKRDRRSDEEYAVVREAFIREANFGAQLTGNPHIMPVHTVGTIEGRDYFEMDWVEGASLSKFCAEKGPLDPWAALMIAWMVLDALQYAHQANIRIPGANARGIVHRDVKPANIMIDLENSRLLLADFGISVARDAARGRRGVYTAGTINYLPPELLKDEPADVRSDVYQVGLVLYEMLCGERAFPGGEKDGVKDRIRFGDYSRLGRRLKRLDQDVVGVVEQAIGTDPATRQQTAAEMRDQIDSVLRKKYVPHDRQQALRKYLRDAIVPSTRVDVRVKRARPYLLKTLWVVAALAVVSGLYFGIDAFIKWRCERAFQDARAEYQPQRDEWDRQGWDQETVNQTYRNIDAMHSAGEVSHATDSLIGLTGKLKQEVESARLKLLQARDQYNAEYDIFLKQSWPGPLRDKMTRADDSLKNHEDIYLRAESAYVDQAKRLGYYDSAKADTFGTQFDRLEQKNRDWIAKLADKSCLDSAKNFGGLIAGKRAEDSLAGEYQRGIAWVRATLHSPPSWVECKVPVVVVLDTSLEHGGDDTLPPCEEERGALVAVRKALEMFRSESGWESHSQSRVHPKCSVKNLDGYVQQADDLLQDGRCADARGNIETARKGVGRLFGEWAEWAADSLRRCSVPVPSNVLTGLRQPYDDQPWQSMRDCLMSTLGALSECNKSVLPPPPVPLLDPDSALVLGRRAYYRESRCGDAYKLLSQVLPESHSGYRIARLLMGHSRCCQEPQGIYDEVTIRLYREAGPLVDGPDNARCDHNLAQCFFNLKAYDSVDVYFDEAVGTGKLKCDDRDQMYANLLYVRVNADYERYKAAKEQGDAQGMTTYCSDLAEKAMKFFECFRNPQWKSWEETIRAKYDECRNP